MTRRKKWWWMAGVAALPLLGFISYITTFFIADGRISPGTWIIRVLKDDGKPVSGAQFILDIPKYDPSATYVFENYKGPGSIVSDRNGMIKLQNDRYLSFGCTGWKLFWIYRISDEDMSFLFGRYVLISAPGYETIALSPNEIMEKKEFVVTFKKGGVSPRPDR